MDAFTAIFTPFVASSAEVAAPASAARGETRAQAAQNGVFCVIA
jgi:hypothetical protein